MSSIVVRFLKVFYQIYTLTIKARGTRGEANEILVAMHIWTANLMSLSLCYFPHQYHSHFTILNIIIKMIYYQAIMGILCICFALFAGSKYQSNHYQQTNFKVTSVFKELSCQRHHCISYSGVITTFTSKSSLQTLSNPLTSKLC